jgi:predicted TIM-barrel fold metal-dependent hydrolase
MTEVESPSVISRREFVARSALTICGAAISASNAESATEPIVDIHQHLAAGRNANTPSTHDGVSNGLQAQCLGNEACRQFAKAHAREFRFGANEVPDIDGAVQEIERYLKRGAIVIAEQKFGVECDSREMQAIYALAAEHRVPVLMHWQYQMYNYGFERFHRMLEKYPKVIFLGHAQTWWGNIDKNNVDQSVMYPKGPVAPGGLTDRYLSDYPNMFGDLSAGSGLNALTRDEDFARDFITRHQDKLIYGSDCSDRVGSGAACQGSQTIAAIRRLAPSKAVERKLLYGNAKKLFRL